MLLETSSSEEPGITLDRVRFGYDQRPILHDLSWELGQGRAAVMMGANGCGKSTLLYVAAGLVPPRQGSVLLGGHPVAAMWPSKRVQKGIRIGFVFQEGGLLSNMGAYANVALALKYHFDVLGLDESQIDERVEQALDATQVSRAHWQEPPSHLSFGLRKRLAMARAIALEPNYFFFDDPDVGLDPQTAMVMHQLLCQLRDDPTVTMLVATNRGLLVDRLEVPGFRLDGGRLSARSPHSSIPPSWPARAPRS